MTTGSDLVERQYDWAEISPTLAVLETLAIFEYDDPEKRGDVLDEPLYNHIDPDGLDVIATSNTAITIEFSTSDYHIQVKGNTVTITESH